MNSIVHYITGTHAEYFKEGEFNTLELLNLEDWHANRFRLFTPFEDIEDASISILALPLGLPIILVTISVLSAIASITSLLAGAGYLVSSTSIIWKEENRQEFLSSSFNYTLLGFALGLISLVMILLTAISIPLTLCNTATRSISTLVAWVDKSLYETNRGSSNFQ